MKRTVKTIDKQVSHAFGKDVYLLGEFWGGEKFWLEAASWDCGWYWGFGHIETYTNNNSPEHSRDINSHEHYSGLCFLKPEVYDTDSHCFKLSSDYCHILSDNSRVMSTTLTESEQWTLSELMKTAYNLKEAAEVFGRGGSHYGTNPLAETIKNPDMVKHINEVLLPAIFKEVYALLTPVK